MQNVGLMRMSKTRSTEQSNKVEIKKTKIYPFFVIAQVPWLVTNIESVESACNIAVVEASKKLPYYADIDVLLNRCPSCSKVSKAVFLVGNTALVSLGVGMRVVADSEEGAKRVFTSILKKSLDGKPFKVISVEKMEKIK